MDLAQSGGMHTCHNKLMKEPPGLVAMIVNISNSYSSAVISAMMRYGCLETRSVKSSLIGRLIRHSVLVHRFLACERMHGTPLRAVAFSRVDEHHHE